MSDSDLEVTASTPDKLREQALHRIKKRKDFQSHVVVYLLVNALLWGLWAIGGADSDPVPWPLWVSGGWGIGLAFNAWDVYGRKPITEDEIEREVGRIQGRP